MQKIILVALCLLAGAGCGRARPAPPEPPILPVTRKWLTLVESGFGPLATDGARVFVATAERLYALHRATGAQAWKRDGLTGTVAAVPGIVAVRSADGTVVALDPQTGTTRWSADTGSTGTLPPLVEGARVVVAGSRLVALDAAAGRRLFEQALASAAVTTPVQAGPCILLGEADGALRCHDSQTGAVRWTYLMDEPLAAPPYVHGDRVFVGTTDRRAISLDLRTGGQDWRFKLGADVSVSPTASDDLALIASNESVLYALGRGNGHMRWRAALPSRPLGPPLVEGVQVLIGCHPNQLLAFDLVTGKGAGVAHVGVERLEPKARSSEIRVPPLRLERMIFVGIRNPSAVIGLEPGAPPGAPEPPPPFVVEPADPLATPAPTAAPTATPNP